MDTSSEKSAWNLGIMTLDRIDKLLKECELYSFENNYQAWARKLINLYKELRPLTIKNQEYRSEMDTKIKFAKDIDKMLNFDVTMANFKETERKLDDIELLLRDIIIFYDLYLPKKDDPRFAVLQR